MNNPTFFIAFVLTLFSLVFIYYLKKNIPSLLIHLTLLLLTPWFLILLFGKPTISDYLYNKPRQLSISNNFSILTSSDLLFFESFPKLKYSVGDYGDFLPSFMPLIVIGFWGFLTSKSSSERKVLMIFCVLLILSCLLFYKIGYLSSIIFLIFLSIFATNGLLKFINLFKTKRRDLVLKSLIMINLMFIVYESLRLFHSLNIQLNLQK